MRNRIREIMDERCLHVTAFAREIGVPQSTMSTIYHGTTSFEKIRIDTFVRIAHGLGMTADSLWDDASETVRREEPLSLSRDERTVIESFRDTDERGRQTILAVARSQRGMSGEPEDFIADAS